MPEKGVKFIFYADGPKNSNVQMTPHVQRTPMSIGLLREEEENALYKALAFDSKIRNFEEISKGIVY